MIGDGGRSKRSGEVKREGEKRGQGSFVRRKCEWDPRARRSEKRVAERDPSAKRRHVVELGRVGADYGPTTKRRRGGEDHSDYEHSRIVMDGWHKNIVIVEDLTVEYYRRLIKDQTTSSSIKSSHDQVGEKSNRVLEINMGAVRGVLEAMSITIYDRKDRKARSCPSLSSPLRFIKAFQVTNIVIINLIQERTQFSPPLLTVKLLLPEPHHLLMIFSF
ncbi:hypothetical protein FEM48_Zijuj11G0163800 [Ziziphus jujuba var. spinosa]|uniref:Uncharacterized protein n=1 Tax=Ziziphus jujuba var. spinosa TaxID=714518 RepID=A0A978UK04_ZIZJJ|nr:hypothetical protein FEM48_Zijuj11G0163800 [Ziziphus jujuba var. spinosa]